MNLITKTSYYRFKLMTKAYNKWLKKNERTLDVGCGRGTITKLLADYYSLKIQAADIKNYLLYDIPFKKIRNGKLPKFRNKFDAIFLNDVLHHISKQEQENLIKESLKNAEKVLIFEMKPTLMAKIGDSILNKFHYGDLKIPLTFRNINDWHKVFKKLNVKHKTLEIPRPFWYPFSHIAFLIQKK